MNEQKIEESYVTDLHDFIFVKDKKSCVYIYVCLYIHVYAKENERIHINLFTVITSGE